MGTQLRHPDRKATATAPSGRGLFRWLRAIATVFVFTAATGLVAGCGDSDRDPSGVREDDSVSVSKAQIEAYAHVVNLRAADLPGMAIRGQEAAFNGLPFGSGVDRCDGVVGRTGEVTGVISPAFISRRVRERRLPPNVAVTVGPKEGIYSVVYVMKSEALAERAAVAAGSARTRACLTARRDAHPEKLAGEPARAQVEVSSLPPSLLPGVRLYGLRETGTLPVAFGNGRTRPAFYVDVIGFPVGQSDIVLRIRSTPRPVPAATERRLLLLLFHRAQAHRL